MAQDDNHPNPKTRQGRQHRQELAPYQSTEHSGQNAEKAPAAQNTHPFLHCSTWLSEETLNMHCTVVDHRRNCCRLLKKKAGSPNSARRDRSDSCIPQCGPSKTARLYLQHQHTVNNPSPALQLYAEQVSQCSFSATTIFQHRLRTSS